jgi:flagellar protein FlbT
MALKLSLKPFERIAVNGAVLVNGPRRTEFALENQAHVLRERDVMRPEEADTPAKRIYLPIVLMTLDPSRKKDYLPEYERRLTEFTAAVLNPEILNLCAALAAHVANGDTYKALLACRELIEFERERLAHVA